MNKGLLRAAIMVAMLLPGLAAALGMGEIEGHSYLNQPLEARIPLKSYSSADIKDLRVGLASEAEFARAGVDYSAVLRQLKFKIMRSTKTQEYYIRVYTTTPIRDAYLNFLIEVNWPEGRLIREYTLLLDPPDLTSSTAPGVITPQQSEPQAQQPQQKAAPKPAPKPAPQNKNQPIVYGPVRINETLWDIAKKIRGNRTDISIEQVIMALLRNNPNAFINNNVNNLKAGVILRIDNPDDIRAMSRSQAAQEFHRQYQEWLDYKRRRATHPQPEKQGYGQDTAQQSATQGSNTSQGSGGTLKLAPPKAEDKRQGQMGQTGNDQKTSERIAQLQKQLNDAMSAAASGKQENEQLRERLKSLEDQLASLQRVVTVKSDELANLQQQLQKEQSELDSKMAADAAQAAPEKEANREPQAEDVEKTTPQEQGPGFIEKLANGVQSWYRNPLQTGITAGLFVLLLVLMLLYVRQRRRARDNVIYSSNLEQNARYKDDFFEADGGDDSWTRDLAFEEEMEGGMPEDPMAQADIYIAFGKYDEAVELMEQAIEADPDNLALKVKLDDILNLKSKPRTIALGETESPAAIEEEAFESAAEPEPVAEFEEITEPEMPEPVPEAPQPEPAPAHENFNEHDVEMVPIEDNDNDFDGFPNYGSDYTKPYEAGLISEDEISSFHQELMDEPGTAGVALDVDAAAESGDVSTATNDALDFNVDDLSFDTTEELSSPDTTTKDDNSLDFDLGDLESLSDTEVEAKTSDEDTDSDATLEFDTGDLDSLLETDEDLMLTSTADEADELSWESTLDNVEEEESAAGTEGEELADLDSLLGDENTEEPEISDTEFEELQELMAEDEHSAELAQEEKELEMDLDSELSTALDELEQELDMPEIDLASDDDVDLLNTVDEVGTKLDLAKAYMDMGDPDGARSILEEVLEEGSEKQKQEAASLLEQLSEMA